LRGGFEVELEGIRYDEDVDEDVDEDEDEDVC
jgi:hypothetical protein